MELGRAYLESELDCGCGRECGCLRVPVAMDPSYSLLIRFDPQRRDGRCDFVMALTLRICMAWTKIRGMAGTKELLRWFCIQQKA